MRRRITVPDRQEPCVPVQSNPATFRTLDGLRLAATARHA